MRHYLVTLRVPAPEPPYKEPDVWDWTSLLHTIEDVHVISCRPVRATSRPRVADPVGDDGRICDIREDGQVEICRCVSSQDHRPHQMVQLTDLVPAPETSQAAERARRISPLTNGWSVNA